MLVDQPSAQQQQEQIQGGNQNGNSISVLGGQEDAARPLVAAADRQGDPEEGQAAEEDEAEEDAVSRFFLRDTAIRVDRIIEVALAYGGFALLLYCRFLCPGGVDVWRWLEPAALWIVVFLPLFALDIRNVQHVKYLRRHRDHFTPNDSQRHVVMCLAEFLYKALLCVHLMFPDARSVLSLKIVMLPYAAGYVLHFILGHLAPLEDNDRAEGCNVIASLLSELARFLQFVLIVVLSLKVDSTSSALYNWQAAFWPCWGLEGIVIMIVILLLPLCMISALVDCLQMLMLTWVVVTGAGLSVASFISMYNIATLLDKHLCPDPVSKAAGTGGSQGTYIECRQYLERSLWPWLIYLPAFAVGTLLIKSRLVRALHAAWYQTPFGDQQQGSIGAAAALLGGRRMMSSSADVLISPSLPAPRVMFRMTPTFYSRHWMPGFATSSMTGGAAPQSGSIAQTGPKGSHIHAVAAASATAAAPTSSLCPAPVGTSTVVDPHTSILSARGTTFVDVVESEQLCFICYNGFPDGILMECGHAGMCVECARQIMARVRASSQHAGVCPICRGVISSVLRIRQDRQLPSDLFLDAGHTSLPQSQHGLVHQRLGDGSSGAPPSGCAEDNHPCTLENGPPWPVAARRTAVCVEEACSARSLRPGGRRHPAAAG